MRVRELEVTMTTPEFLANIMGWTVGLLIERDNSRKRGERNEWKAHELYFGHIDFKVPLRHSRRDFK